VAIKEEFRFQDWSPIFTRNKRNGVQTMEIWKIEDLGKQSEVVTSFTPDQFNRHLTVPAGPRSIADLIVTSLFTGFLFAWLRKTKCLLRLWACNRMQLAQMVYL